MFPSELRSVAAVPDAKTAYPSSVESSINVSPILLWLVFDESVGLTIPERAILVSAVSNESAKPVAAFISLPISEENPLLFALSGYRPQGNDEELNNLSVDSTSTFSLL